MPVVVVDETVQAQPNKLADLTAKIAGDLAAGTAHLFTNNVDPGPSGDLTTLTEAAWAGYAPQAVAGWTAAEATPGGGASTDATTVLTFVGPAGGGGPSVHGYFIRSAGAGTPIIYYCKFAAPVNMASDANTLHLVPTLRLP